MRTLLSALLLMSSTAYCADVAKEKPASAGAVARLIEQLGDREFAKREEASRALREIGEPALAALHQARASTDVEVRRRASQLVRQIEQQAEMTRLLTPTRVRLTFKETPLPEAVEQFAKKAGVAIQLQGDREGADEQKVTLDTGETTLWKALEQLCRKGNLVEMAPPPPAKEKQGVATTGSIIIIGGGGGFKPQPKDLLKNAADDEDRPIILSPGKARTEPADMGSAVRVRLLPSDAKLPGQPRGEDEYLIGIEPISEPRTVWKGVLGLRLSKAIDDQNQSLVNLTTIPKPESPANRGGGTVTINSIPISAKDNGNQGVPGPIPFRLRKGEKPAKSIKELTGTFIAFVQTPFETLAKFDDIMKAKGQTVKMAQGGFVKIVEVAHQDDEVRVKLQVEAPPTGLDDGVGVPLNATVIINGEEVGKRKHNLNAKSFVLLNDKGKPLTVTKSSDTGVRAGMASEIELVFQAGKDQGTPSGFLYQGRRTVLVEVPFTLKDIPLPR